MRWPASGGILQKMTSALRGSFARGRVGGRILDVPRFVQPSGAALRNTCPYSVPDGVFVIA